MESIAISSTGNNDGVNGIIKQRSEIDVFPSLKYKPPKVYAIRDFPDGCLNNIKENYHKDIILISPDNDEIDRPLITVLDPDNKEEDVRECIYVYGSIGDGIIKQDIIDGEFSLAKRADSSFKMPPHPGRNYSCIRSILPNCHELYKRVESEPAVIGNIKKQDDSGMLRRSSRNKTNNKIISRVPVISGNESSSQRVVVIGLMAGDGCPWSRPPNKQRRCKN